MTEAPQNHHDAAGEKQLPQPEKLESKISQIVDAQTYRYKVWIQVISAVASALVAFFGFKVWPDFQRAAKESTNATITEKIVAAVGEAKANIEADFKEHRDRMNGRLGELDRRISSTVDDLNRKMGSVEQRFTTKLETLDATQRRYEENFASILREAQTRQAQLVAELDQLEKKKRASDIMLTGLENGQTLVQENMKLVQAQLGTLREQQAQLANALSETTRTGSALGDEQKKIEGTLKALSERSQALALLLGEQEFALALRKLRNEMFRIQNIEARVIVAVPAEAEKKMKRPQLAAGLSRLQVNLRRHGEPRNCIEFAPSETPTLIQTKSENGEVLHEYASTEAPYELFVPAFKGRELKVLDGTDIIRLTQLIGEEAHTEYQADIEHFYSSVEKVTVQIYVNGLLVAEKHVSDPKFERQEQTDDGRKLYVYFLTPCDFGGCLKDAKNTYEQRLLALR